MKIRKESTTLINDAFDPAKSVPLVFHFEPCLFSSSEERLKNCSIRHQSVESKDIYIIDDYFFSSEKAGMRAFSQSAPFSKLIYGSKEGRDRGEKPARSMTGKERWGLFAAPPPVIGEFFKLLSTLSVQLDGEITTLPWELCKGTISSPALATNFLEEVSQESTDLGIHDDYSTEEGISFGIPVLYANEKQFHPSRFVNGEAGRPWLISAILYSADEKFRPEYGMGTLFYNKDKKQAFRTDCVDLRIALFEGDILHSIEPSHFPPNTATWRVSYVFKLIMNPKRVDQSMKKAFFEACRESFCPRARSTS